jgi:hypothetical protein
MDEFDRRLRVPQPAPTAHGDIYQAWSTSATARSPARTAMAPPRRTWTTP